MRFSVVIPLYNKRNYIARALQSVLDQTEAFKELIVVDDGSTDGGAGEAQIFRDSRIRVISQANGGEAAARNRGIAAATGTHVAFLDADDCWQPDLLATLAHLIRMHPQGSVYGTGYQVAEPQGSVSSPLRGIERFIADDRLDYFAALARWCFPLSSSSVCVPRARFDEVGPFDEKLKLATDIDMWVRLCLAGPAFFASKPLATYHKDAENRSNAQSDFWIKRLLFVRSLQQRLQGATIKQRDRANLRRFLSQVTYEALVGASSADGSGELPSGLLELIGVLRSYDRVRLTARRMVDALRRSRAH